VHQKKTNRRGKFSSYKLQIFPRSASIQGLASHLQANARRKREMQLVLEQNYIAEKIINRTEGVFGDKIGIFGKVFGCWHGQLSRPFTSVKESYRVCLDCGARKQFDTQTLKTFGPFYYPPAISLADGK
jgi:hypothetical protein